MGRRRKGAVCGISRPEKLLGPDIGKIVPRDNTHGVAAFRPPNPPGNHARSPDIKERRPIKLGPEDRAWPHLWPHLRPQRLGRPSSSIVFRTAILVPP